MSAVSVQRVLTARARLGECPVWDPHRRQLAWVDIYNHRVHEFDPATGRDRFVEIGELVAAIAPTVDDRLLIAQRDRLALLDFPSGAVEPLCPVELPEDTRLNDGKCDARGRFWVGSISATPGEAALYRYDPDGSLHVMETGLTISNGLGWSPDGTIFYLTDSPKRAIYAYRFDEETGAIADRRTVVDLRGEEVEPDGLAIDREGNLWSALWDGWSVACFDADGHEIQRTPIPVQRPTSLAFGGQDLAELFVTTASVGLSQEEIERGVYAGDLFRLTPTVGGLPPHPFGAPQSAR
jgi:sugar lactone lactonase YvrE